MSMVELLRNCAGLVFFGTKPALKKVPGANHFALEPAILNRTVTILNGSESAIS